MPRALSAAQEASAAYIVQQLTPLHTTAEMDARIAAIHLMPGRAAGPNCGCHICITQYGLLGAEILDAAPTSAVPPADEPVPTFEDAIALRAPIYLFVAGVRVRCLILGVPFPVAWRNYLVALRNITLQPNPHAIAWPVQPPLPPGI